MREIVEDWDGQDIAVDGVVIRNLFALKRGFGTAGASGAGWAFFLARARRRGRTSGAHWWHNFRLQYVEVFVSGRDLAFGDARGQ